MHLGWFSNSQFLVYPVTPGVSNFTWEYFTKFIKLNWFPICVLGMIFLFNPNTCLFLDQSLENKTFLTGGESTIIIIINENACFKKLLTVQNDRWVKGQCVWSVVQHQMLLVVVVYWIMRYVGRKNILSFSSKTRLWIIQRATV